MVCPNLAAPPALPFSSEIWEESSGTELPTWFYKPLQDHFNKWACQPLRSGSNPIFLAGCCLWLQQRIWESRTYIKPKQDQNTTQTTPIPKNSHWHSLRSKTSCFNGHSWTGQSPLDHRGLGPCSCNNVCQTQRKKGNISYWLRAEASTCQWKHCALETSSIILLSVPVRMTKWFVADLWRCWRKTGASLLLLTEHIWLMDGSGSPSTEETNMKKSWQAIENTLVEMLTFDLIYAVDNYRNLSVFTAPNWSHSII